jgi:3-oxoacyl-(acyl-carrier-protein) synthase
VSSKVSKVVVTGIGIVNPSGIGKDEFWGNSTEGKSAIRNISRFDPTGYPTQVAGEISNFDPADFIPRRFIVKTDRFTHYALAATELAVKDAELDLEKKILIGLAFGLVTMLAGGTLLSEASTNFTKMAPQW